MSLRESAESTKLGCLANDFDEIETIQKDLKRLKQWVKMNRVEFNREAYIILPVSRRTVRHKCGMGVCDLTCK